MNKEKLKKENNINFKIIVLSILLSFCMLILGMNTNVHAASVEYNPKEPEEYTFGDPLKDVTMFQENKDYVDIYNNCTWKCTKVYYWQVNHRDCTKDFWRWPGESNFWCDDESHSYLFTRIEDEKGNPIKDIRYIKYTYVDENGEPQSVDVKPTNVLTSSNYESDGNFIKLKDVVGFGMNSEVEGKFEVPGLSKSYRRYDQYKSVRSECCKIAYTNEEVSKLDFITNDHSNVKPYTSTDFVLYFPDQQIQHLVYLYCWYMVENPSTGEQELEAGSFSENGEHPLLDANGNATGVYDVNNNLLKDYTLTEGGLPVDDKGYYTIHESDQKMGTATVKVSINKGFDMSSILPDFTSIGDAVNNVNKTVSNIVNVIKLVLLVILCLLIIYIIYKFLKFIYRLIAKIA